MDKELRKRSEFNLELMRDDEESDWPNRLLHNMANVVVSPKTLAPSEIDVLFFKSYGLTSKEIAKLTHRSENTVKTHLKMASAKLAAKNTAHAVAIAMRNDLIL